jgi:hypothetical protein
VSSCIDERPPVREGSILSGWKRLPRQVSASKRPSSRGPSNAPCSVARGPRRHRPHAFRGEQDGSTRWPSEPEKSHTRNRRRGQAVRYGQRRTRTPSRRPNPRRRKTSGRGRREPSVASGVDAPVVAQEIRTASTRMLSPYAADSSEKHSLHTSRLVAACTRAPKRRGYAGRHKREMPLRRLPDLALRSSDTAAAHWSRPEHCRIATDTSNRDPAPFVSSSRRIERRKP